MKSSKKIFASVATAGLVLLGGCAGMDGQNVSVTGKEAARKEAETALEFANTLRAQGYSEDTIVKLYCMRLADRAGRFGIPHGVNCVGASGDNIGVAVSTGSDKTEATATPGPKVPAL